jgi:hypothetical protein
MRDTADYMDEILTHPKYQAFRNATRAAGRTLPSPNLGHGRNQWRYGNVYMQRCEQAVPLYLPVMHSPSCVRSFITCVVGWVGVDWVAWIRECAWIQCI